MMRQITSTACGIWLCLAVPLVAQSNQGIVVELYTSQGCSSCPPADAYFAELVEQSGVIPLALHVDYWDYIGWEDTFGNQKFTERQRAYARASGRKMVFTPQVIVSGGESVEGNRPSDVAAAITRSKAARSGVRLDLERVGGRVMIRATANPALSANTKVQLVRFRAKASVDIIGGENAGRSITYHNIVTSWVVLGDWAGNEPLELSAGVAGADGVVVIIQTAGPSEILAAAELK